MATFLGREAEWVDRETGEVVPPPVTVGIVTYPGGGEVFGVRPFAGKRGRGASELREYRQRCREEREFGPEVALLLANERSAERAERSASEAARRARTIVRRLTRRYVLDHMVTLTFPGEGVHEYNEALRYFQDFVHDHGSVLHLGKEWLAVPELHPGGHGWHWHVLVSRRFRRFELAALREGWTEFLRRRGLEPSGGANYARIDVKVFRSSGAAASYAAKYAGKSFDGDDRGKGRKRYLHKRGMAVEVLRGGAMSVDEVRLVAEQIRAEFVVDSNELADWHGPSMVYARWRD